MGEQRAGRVLVLAPHPDDEALGCGGTLARHKAEGARLRVLFLTSGERGGHGRERAETARVREREARRSAAVLGVDEVEFWRLPDGRLQATGPVTSRLRAEVERFRPDLVYAPHAGEAHADHRAAARLLRRALEGLGRGSRPEAYLFEVWTPLARLDRLVDISEHLAAKLRAIRAYRSQCRVVGFDQAMRGLARYRGEMHAWPGGDYAEAFRRG